MASSFKAWTPLAEQVPESVSTPNQLRRALVKHEVRPERQCVRPGHTRRQRGSRVQNGYMRDGVRGLARPDA